jgi:hypothetical protein
LEEKESMGWRNWVPMGSIGTIGAMNGWCDEWLVVGWVRFRKRFGKEREGRGWWKDEGTEEKWNEWLRERHSASPRQDREQDLVLAAEPSRQMLLNRERLGSIGCFGDGENRSWVFSGLWSAVKCGKKDPMALSGVVWCWRAEELARSRRIGGWSWRVEDWRGLEGLVVVLW